MSTISFIVLTFWITCCLSQSVDGDDLMQRTKVLNRKKPYTRINKYIECQVCEFTAQSMFNVWLLSMNTNQYSFDETEMYHLVVETCNPWSNIGVWITSIDIELNDDDQLELMTKEDIGECNRECETIRSICEDIAVMDADEIAEYFWNNKDNMDLDALTKYLCADACPLDDKMPQVPTKLANKFEAQDEEWVPMSYEEKQKRVEIFQQLRDEQSDQTNGREL
eukprot:604834_1